MRYSLQTLLMLIVGATLLVHDDVSVSFLILLPIVLIWFSVGFLLKNLPESLAEGIRANQQFPEQELRILAAARELAAFERFQVALYLRIGIPTLIWSSSLFAYFNKWITHRFFEKIGMWIVLILITLAIITVLKIARIWLAELGHFSSGVVERNRRYGGDYLNESLERWGDENLPGPRRPRTKSV